MHRLPLSASLSLVLFTLAHASPSLAQQRATMSVDIVASGNDSTRSEGEWTRATFSYRASFSIPVESDGELSDVNLYDPQYAEKALAQANAAMERMQAALRGEFSDEEEVEPDNRYMLFTGQLGCGATLSIEVEERLEGEYADVGGMQPYTISFSGKSEGQQQERDMLCISGTSVLDVKDDTLYRSGVGLPEISGHYVYNEANRGNLQDDDQARQQAMPPFVMEYVVNTLRVAPAKGQLKTQLKPEAPVVTRINVFGGYQGNVDLEMSWDFVRD